MTKSTLLHTVTPRTTAAATGPLHNIFAFMSGLISNIAAGTSSWTGKFAASLHETRQQQARYTLDRYRHLVSRDSDQASDSKRH